MHILLTGGGSGGHVTPLLAVAHELKTAHPDCTLSYIGEKGGKFARLVEESQLFANINYIHAGKFRRYDDESRLSRILDVKTNLLNIRDVFKTMIGCVQAWRVVRKLRPDAMFAKGGFVSVPVGVACNLQNVPFMTHDSDAIPGLANRIIGRWAALHATGMPVKFYDYPKDKTIFVGVPISDKFVTATPQRIAVAKQELDLPEQAKVVFVTGGSQGSDRINEVFVKITPKLLVENNNLYIIHHVGKGNELIYGSYKERRLIISAYFDNFDTVATAADVVITRAGANSMAEFAQLQKATIVIPSPFLANGHQLENARQLAMNDAIINIDEAAAVDSPDYVAETIQALLSDATQRSALANNLGNLAKPDAAKRLAELVISIGVVES